MNKKRTICFITTGCVTFRTRLFELLEKNFGCMFYFHGTSRKYNCDYGELKWYRQIKPSFQSVIKFAAFDIWIKCINNPVYVFWLLLWAKILHKKFILWTGTWYLPNTLSGKLRRIFYKGLYQGSDAIVTYGNHVKRYLVESEKIKDDKIFCAYQVVDNDKFNRKVSTKEIDNVRKRLDLPRNKEIILCVARLENEKGVIEVLDSYYRMNNHEIALVYVGEGKLKEKLQKRIKKLNLKNVRFTGAIPNNSLVPFYAASSIMCLFSKTSKFSNKEPWGVVLNEAMNQGVPCIASDSVGAAVGGLVRDGYNGFIVPEGDIDALRKTIEYYFENRSLQTGMRKNCKETISSWTYDFMIKGFSNAIHHVDSDN